MHNRDRAVMAGLLIVAALAIGGAAMMVASGHIDLYLATGSLAVLAIVQIAVVTLAWPRFSDQDQSHAETGGLVRSLFEKSSATDSRLVRLEQQVMELQDDSGNALIEEVRGLRESVAGLLHDLARPATDAEPPSTAAEPPRAEPLPLRDRLDLLLEPMVELNSGATMHYRAQVTMGGGDVVDFASLMDKADAGGMRPALELHILKQALPVLRRLRVKHPNLRLLVPIGAATLNGANDLGKVIAALKAERDAAAGIVFDLHQSDIGRLDDAGIAGLAQLGRVGAVMALSDVEPTGLDLASLRQLGVRYLIVDAASFEPGFGTSPAWKAFAQYVRAMQFQIVAGNVDTAQQASAATRVARFGYGPFFAPPRKVKAGAGLAAGNWQDQAA